MQQELRSEIESVMNARHIENGPLGGFLSGKQVEQVWKDFLRGAVSWSRPWALFVLQRWCELNL